MRNSKKCINYLLLTSSLFCSTALTSCFFNKNNEEEPTVVEKNTFTLNESSKELAYGDSFKLSASFPSGKVDAIKWTSTNDQVVTVNENGLVNAVNLGEAYVVAESADCSRTCKFVVSFGKNIPELVINNIDNDSIYMASGSSFSINAKINFKNNLYDTVFDGAVDNEEIIRFEDEKIVALSVGSTKLTVTASWNGVATDYIKKVLTVYVVENVSFYSNITIGDETTITNAVSLSSVASWCGKTYNTNAIIEPVIYIDGQYHMANFEIENNGVVTCSGNSIYAKKPGTNTINLYYDDPVTSKRYNSSIKIDVTCPIETYTGDLVKFSGEERFPADVYFGAGAKILSAVQNGVELKVHDNYIDGLDQLGPDSKPLQITTDKGGYIFNDLFIYTRLIDKNNFLATFLLNGSNVINGYYLLKEDISEVIDFKTQKTSNKSSYFAGVFDGQGYSFKALVGANGIFGGFGNGAKIKDCKMTITFDNTNANGSYSGLGSNTSVFLNNDWAVTLQNLHITTTNFAANCHALFEYRPNNLEMYNNYIEINGGESLTQFTDCEQNYSALFRYDVTPLTGPSNQFYGSMRNNYVVTGQFMPLANGQFDGMKGRYVSYAKNDDTYLKAGDDISMVHSTDRADQSRYRIVYPGKTATDAQKKLYGFINVPELVTTSVIPNLETPMAALYLSSYSDGGILRYDEKSEVPVSMVGTWEIK